MKIFGRLIDIHLSQIYSAVISISNGKIESVERSEEKGGYYIMPGLIDAHVHIESSMVTPGAFAEMAVRHGTIGVVSDPHEIANVVGIAGVNFMVEDARKCPMYFWFGAPSCVPATDFETSGGVIGIKEIEELLEKNEIKYLSEMMNFPGVIYNDKTVYEKIKIARKFGKPIDGHAPGLTGESLKKYVSSGITTDHECSSLEEAREKISLGMKILIREGSAARNLNALKDLFRTDAEMLMLCCDDIHPEMLGKGHINKRVSKLINDGYDIFDVVKSCTMNPVNHYGLEAGLLRPGDSADFIVVNDPSMMNIIETWIQGKKVFGNGKVCFSYAKGNTVNNFNCSEVNVKDIAVKKKGSKLRVIEAFNGKLLTSEYVTDAGQSEFTTSISSKDILKIVVKDRYNDLPPSIGFIKGFGLKSGAFASSVAHDSHNIICVGTDDASMIDCINEIVRLKGGLAVSNEGKINSLQLNIGGIMSDESCSGVADKYEELSHLIIKLGCSLSAPFMTLSFMTLLVIPNLKISDRGLFDVNKFSFTSLFTD